MIRKLLELLNPFKQDEQKLPQKNIGSSADRYQMTYDQPCQIDCRVVSCKFYKGAGVCENISPAITLNKDRSFVCWSQQDR